MRNWPRAGMTWHGIKVLDLRHESLMPKACQLVGKVRKIGKNLFSSF